LSEKKDKTAQIKKGEREEEKETIEPMTFLEIEKETEGMTFFKKEKEMPVCKTEYPGNADCQCHTENASSASNCPKAQRVHLNINGPASSPLPSFDSSNVTYSHQEASSTDSIITRLRRCGMLPAASKNEQPPDLVSPYQIRGVSSKLEGSTSMMLAKKVKGSLSVRVYQHRVYVFQNGCYKFMPQDDMEEMIWKICKVEFNQAGKKSILSGAYKLLTVDPDLREDRINNIRNIVPFLNGLLQLDSGIFLPSSPEYFLTYTLNCVYPENAGPCPNFDRYLYDVSGGDKLLIDRIWEFLGYCLTQDVNAKSIFVLQGVSGSGKSVLANLLSAFYPRDVQTALDAHDMGEKFAVGECENKLLCISSDMPAEALGNKAVGNLKKLTGRDTVSSDVKYERRKDFIFTGKILLVTNNPLLLKQDDQAFWNRLVAIPFRHSIPREAQIDDLEDRLETEMSAIAVRALYAYGNLRKRHYRFSGDFVVNEQGTCSANSIAVDPSIQIFIYLQEHYEAWPSGTVILEEACADYNKMYGVSMSIQQFSTLFFQQASHMFQVTKKRTREGGYENARSAVVGIKRKFI